MPFPKLTEEQRAQALAKAAHVRRTRAEWKQALKTRSLTLARLLEMAETDEIAAGMKVSAVLVSMPGNGKVRTKKIMEGVGISESRRLRGLGDRQREQLIDICDKPEKRE